MKSDKLFLSSNYVLRIDKLNSWISDLKSGAIFPINESAKDLLVNLVSSHSLSATLKELDKKYVNNNLEQNAEKFVSDLLRKEILTNNVYPKVNNQFFNLDNISLRSLHLHICGDCNHNCIFCYSALKPKSIPINILENVILKCIKSLGTYSIGLSGGEPLLYDKFSSIIDTIVTQNCHCTIFSNASTYKSEFIKYLKTTNRISFSFSLHTLSLSIHKRISRSGTKLNQIINNIEKFKNDGFQFRIGSVFVKDFNDDLQEIEKLFKYIKLLSPDQYSYTFFVPMGASSNRKNLIPNLDKIEKIELLYKEIFKQQNPEYDLCDTKLLNNQLRPCELGYGILNINEDGTITPCPSLQLVELGNIYKDDIEDIWHNSLWLKNYRELKFINLEKCNSCKYFNICRGGCRGIAMSLSGSITSPDLYSCYKFNFN